MPAQRRFVSAFDDPDDWNFGEEESAAHGQSWVGGLTSQPPAVPPSAVGKQPRVQPVAGDAVPLTVGSGECGLEQTCDPDDYWSRFTAELMKDVVVNESLPTPSRWAHLGTESQRAAAREESAKSSMGYVEACGHMPVALPQDEYTPSEAFERRSSILTQVAASREAERSRSRRVRTVQEKSYCRPRRTQEQKVLIGTVNPNSFNVLREELVHGHVLSQVHYLTVQEHLCRGEACDRAAREASAAGWSTVMSPAYFKHSAPGGGTAVLALQGRGAVDFPVAESHRAHLDGRCTMAYVDVLGGLLLVSYYGRSGVPVAGQIQTLAALGQAVRSSGLPFIIGGDWQISPEALMQTKFPHRLGAEIVAPESPTNLRSGSTLDFFLVSRQIRAAVGSVEARGDLYFSPHVPVVLSISAQVALGASSAMVQPRLLPVGNPPGPMPRAARVNWEGFDEVVLDVGQKMNMWYAAAELELLGCFGLQGSDEEAAFMGLGCHGRTATRRACGRFRGSPDTLGLVGQRIAWTMKSAKAVALAVSALPVMPAVGPRVIPPLEALTDHRHPFFLFLGNRRTCEVVRGLVAIGRRAAAFAVELRKLTVDEVLKPFIPDLDRSLKMLAAVARPQKGAPPLVSCWAVGRKREALLDFEEVSKSMAGALSHALAIKKKRNVADIKQWARHATLKQAHAATKQASFVAAHSASPEKAHRGELTAQAAADLGRKAWANIWHASDEEVSGLLDRVMQGLPGDGEAHSTFFAVRDGPFVPIDLPRIAGEDLRVVCRTFRTGTSVGLDWIRMRHLSLLSHSALVQLAGLMEQVEGFGALPPAATGTVAVALAKKSGGSRLIGVASAFYRLWSRIRYAHVREALEARLARHFLAAAPSQGAQRAVTELALKAEQAQLRGLEAAASLVDISKFYESLTLQDVACAADYFGIPRTVVRLFIAFYLTPRYIRVGKSWASPVFPCRSIVAGCTWATVLVRCFMLGPVERFLEVIQREAAARALIISFKVYVDDLTLLMAASLARLRKFVVRASKMLVDWISGTLKLQVAKDKLVCIASSAEVKWAIHSDMAQAGYKVVLVGPCLGADFSAGGLFRARPTLRNRLAVAGRRRSKLRWWQRNSGSAASIARSGIAGSVTHAAEVSGIPPGPMLALCRTMVAAAPIQAVGSSLTARLAIGGERWRESDPRVLFHNLPLRFLMGWLWDNLDARQPFVSSWYSFRDKSIGWCSRKGWRNVRGPLSAAWAHLLSWGMEWTSPFVIKSRGIEVPFLVWAPARSYQILAEHVRIHLDLQLLIKHAAESQWDVMAVLNRYKHGIDWGLLRYFLASAKSPLTPCQRRGLALAATNGIWEEERKWLAGFLPSGTCLLCFSGQGTKEHRLCSCPGVVHQIDWAWVEGSVPRHPATLDLPDLVPLRLFGWPPAPVERVCAPTVWIQGELTAGRPGTYYGDGSCKWPQAKLCEAAAWPLVHGEVGRELPGISAALEGPFVSSFRGELAAALQFFRVAGVGSEYVGDCKAVIDAIRLEVPAHLTASTSRDADLWRKLHGLVRARRGDFLRVKWVKAHQARQAAACCGPEALAEWEGNRAADSLAKSAAGRHASASRVATLAAATRLASAALVRLAFAASIGLDRSADLPRRRGRRSRASLEEESPGGHEPIALAGGGWKCRVCRVTARTKASLRTFRAVPCRGAFAGRIHASHKVRYTKGVLWCGRCGAYAVEKVVCLSRQCPGNPQSSAAGQRRVRLRAGRVPAASENAAARLHDLPE